MPFFSSLALVLSTASVGTTSFGDAMAPKYDLVCDVAVHAPLCDALHAALQEAGFEAEVVPARSNASDVAFRFEIHDQDDHTLSGRLVWIGTFGQRGEGPTFELSATDVAIQDEMLRAFARQVVLLSPMPS